METDRSAYDTIPYPSTAHAQIHPDRIAALAMLYGFDPAPVPSCRILELGCGDGANLTPIAAAFPGTECVGIDLCASAVDRARAFTRACALKNVTFSCCDVAAPGVVTGAFDFILCHGLYSWVEPGTREAILRLCREHLSSRGLALISFNAFPGSHLRQALRETLRWHVRDLQHPHDRIREARALATFIGSTQSHPDPERAALNSECRHLLQKSDGHIFHDDLAPVNQPFYFHEFIDALHRNNLQFVTDAEPGDFLLMHLPASQREVLAALTDDRTECEQYLDFLLHRRFRQAIIGPRGSTCAPRPQARALAKCWFASASRNTTPEAILKPAATAIFEMESGPRLQTDFLDGKIALAELSRQWPRRLAFPELEHHCRERRKTISPPLTESIATPEALQAFLLEAASARIVTFYAAGPVLPNEPGEFPVAFPPARVELQSNDQVTSAFHLRLKLEERWTRELIARADGSRRRQDLQAELARLVVAAGAEEDTGWTALSADWDSAWRHLASLGLFVR